MRDSTNASLRPQVEREFHQAGTMHKPFLKPQMWGPALDVVSFVLTPVSASHAEGSET